MSSTQGVGGPILPPIDLSLIQQQTTVEEQAKIIKQGGSPLEESQIVNALEFLDSQGIDLEQKHLNRLQAGEPVLTGEDFTVSTSTTEEVLGNPWLRPNPIVAFTITYLELAFILSQVKLAESKEAAQSILLMTQMALDTAKLIKEIGETEGTAQIIAGALSIASGILTLGGGIFAGGASFKIGGKRIGWKNPGDGFELQRRNLMFQAPGQVLNGIGQVIQGIYTMKKAALEAEKEMVQNMQKISERGLNAALDAYRAAEEMLNQILQNLQKVVDEAYKAHGWQVH